jgi:molybdate transport system substrate-binding protein
LIAAICLVLAGGDARADEATIAVATNFLNPMQALETEFESATGHRLNISSGSTGQLYAQMVNGAPFDVLLAADQARPRLLAEAGLGDASSVFTYAVGRLALWSAEPGRVGDEPLSAVLETEFRWLAIAEPALAPYGAAARQALEALGAWESVQQRLVRGQNIAQTFAMIQTGNAEIGFVALSQALDYEGAATYQLVPSELHEPIRQDAILSMRAAGNAAALSFLEFLRSAEAIAIIEAYGYSAGQNP